MGWATPQAQHSLLQPDTVERCDGIDNDCDGLFDGEDPSLDSAEAITVFIDDDGDGFGTPFFSESRCPNDPGFATNDLDCDDADPLLNPQAAEACNGVDDDCDGLVDSDDPDNLGDLLFPDTDGDGHGVAFGARPFCEAAAPGFAPLDDDCNDLNAAIVEGVPWFEDGDGDGFGDDQVALSCFGPAGAVATGGDCDDADITVNPASPELCNDKDDNCDGQLNLGAPGTTLGFFDGDGDGYGTGTAEFLCANVANNNDDCNDMDAAVNPGVVERCDGAVPIDNDCDGLTDADDPDAQLNVWYADEDLDGVGGGAPVIQCERPPGHVAENGDCAPLDITRQFAVYTVVDSPDPMLAQEVASIEEALAHPGRCQFGELEIRLDTQQPQILPPESQWGFEGGRGRLAIVGLGNTPSTVMIGSSIQGTVGDLELVNLRLQDRATPLFELFTGMRVRLVDVDLSNLTLGDSLIVAAVEDNDQQISVDFVRVNASGLTAPSLVDLTPDIELWSEVSMQGLVMEGATFGQAVVQVRSDPSFAPLENGVPRSSTVVLEDAVVTGNTFAASLIEVHGVDRVDVRRSSFQNNTTEGPLFCLEGDCQVDIRRITDDPPNWLAQVDGYPNFRQPRLQLERNLFEENGPTPPSFTPWLLWQHAAVETISEGNLYLNSVPQVHPVDGDIGEMAHLHSLDNVEGRFYAWTSLRDRFTNVSGGLDGLEVDIRVYNSLFWSLNWPRLAGSGTSSLVHDNVFFDAPLPFRGGGGASFTRNLHHEPAAAPGLAWPYDSLPSPVNIGIAYRLEGQNAWGPDEAYIRSLPIDTPLITFHPNLSVRYSFAIPRGELAPETDEDMVLHFLGPTLDTNGQRLVEVAAPWHLDTTSNGIPNAWVSFHGSTFECIGLEPFLSQTDADPDGDNSDNLQEWQDGTWPCLPDTDQDGVLDGMDMAPLDPTKP